MLWSVVKGIAFQRSKFIATTVVADLCKSGFISSVGLQLRLIVFVELLLAHGQGQIGCTLVDGQVLDLWGKGLNDLDAGRASTDDADAFAFAVDSFLGPSGGVELGAIELVESSHRWDVHLGRKPECRNKPSSADDLAACKSDEPHMGGLFEAGADNFAVVFYALAQVPFLINELQVSTNFLVGRIALTPSPLFPDFFARELIDEGIAIYTSSRIAVPIPDTAEIGSLLKESDFVSPLFHATKS